MDQRSRQQRRLLIILLDSYYPIMATQTDSCIIRVVTQTGQYIVSCLRAIKCACVTMATTVGGMCFFSQGKCQRRACCTATEPSTADTLRSARDTAGQQQKNTTRMVTNFTIYIQ